MLTRLGYYADKAIEWGWLAAAVVAPLYFNVYSSRVFEPDKISTVRSLVLLMLVAWLIKLVEGGWRGWQGAGSQTQQAATAAPTRAGRLAAAAGGVVETAAPSWLGFLRVPVVVAILVYALTYIISTVFTVTPDSSIFGSYQRLQGTYSQFSYMLLGVMVLANLRTRAQLDRLVNFMLLTSLPVALYGLIQALHLDPLPWAGDTATRVASTMGNAIFVAAWLIMVVPFALYRLFTGVTGAMRARNAALDTPVEDAAAVGRVRTLRRTRQAGLPSYGWAMIANSVGVMLAYLMVFYMALKMMAGLPYPDGRTWWLLPFAILVFYLGNMAIEWLGKRRDDPLQQSAFLPSIGAIVFFTSFLALTLTWNIDNTNGAQALQMGFNGGGFLWAIFFFLLWASFTAAMFALSAREREESYADSDRGVVRSALNVGYGLLVALQVICIYLTQSRGPWLGLGAGLVAFMVAMWLVGRNRGVRWMARLGGAVTAVTLVLVLFVGLLNIPDSPLQSLDNLPVLGRGIERLSTLTRTEDGTGKVRTLIWQGATNLIVSDPLRTLIGWGPEAMYVAYNKFYPPQLAQVELRNATPDRSHNVEFDQLVTMGVLGLLAYYFLVGTFFFFTLRLLKRATNTRDQLFAIALMAAITAHFIEIQTGIQIASTWTYFYLMIGMLVAFGYYMTGYLRPDGAENPGGPTNGGTPGELIIPTNGSTTAEASLAGTNARPVAATVGATNIAGANNRASATATVAANGKPTAGVPTTQKVRSRTAPTAAQQRQSAPTSTGRGGNLPADGRRRQPTMRYGSAQIAPTMSWIRNPVMLALYALAAVVALIGVFVVNSASVQADTLFKQAQAYDNAQRYFDQIDSHNVVFPGSLPFYDRAIALQPNQDYYYLFLGRAWLEAAKMTDTDQYNLRTGASWSKDPTKAADERYQEKLFRLQTSKKILKEANALSPLNTDHYANLGRLYLYWADPSGGRDPSMAPLAVQWMKEATDHTPGNAQLWDELGVAYTRNNQFQQGIDALNHSQHDVDPMFARTPFIKGELLQERATNIRSALSNGAPLPTDGGETDYGKLALQAGQAYSDTIALDPTQFVDQSTQSRIDFLIEASKLFTKTNTQIPADIVSGILTNTIVLASDNNLKNWEGQLTDFAKQHGIQPGAGGIVPAATLQQLLANPAWSSDGKTWLNDSMQIISRHASVPHYILGLVGQELGDKERARAEYTRALLFNPDYNEAQQALQGLK